MYPKTNTSNQSINTRISLNKEPLSVKLAKAIKIKHSSHFLKHGITEHVVNAIISNYLLEKTPNQNFNKFFKFIEEKVLANVDLLIKQKEVKHNENGKQNNDTCSSEAEESKTSTSRRINLNNAYKILNDINTSTESPSQFISERYDKLEHLKQVKEKDDWFLLIKQDHQRFLEEMKNKKLQNEHRQKELNGVLERQISERKMKIINEKENELKYLNYIRNDLDNWKKKEEEKKLEEKRKIQEFLAKQNELKKSFESLQEENRKRTEKDIKEQLDFFSEQNKKEKQKLFVKKEAERRLYLDQLDQVKIKNSSRLTNKHIELSQRKAALEDYDNILAKLETERDDYRRNIIRRYLDIDERLKLVPNVKEREEKVKQEQERKYLNEVEKLERK